jgi:hypothetical protein
VSGGDARGHDGGVRAKLAAGMIKKRRIYQPRIVGDKVIMPADLKRCGRGPAAQTVSDGRAAVLRPAW